MPTRLSAKRDSIEHVYETILEAEPRPSPAPPPADRQEVLAALRRRLADAGAARSFVQEGLDTRAGVLPVAPELAAMLPGGGLPRGGTVSLVGAGLGAGGVTSLLFGLLAAPSGGWAALVGLPGLGLLAAAEFGVDLAKLVVIPEPGPDVVQVLTLLADGIDVIAVSAPTAPPASGRLRVLQGRLRQRGAVLLVAGPWPGADLVLRTSMAGWSGIGNGHGRLRDRDLVVTVAGRRSAGRRAPSTLALQSSRQAVALRSIEGLETAETMRADFVTVGQSVGTRRKVGA